jgi:putative flippase GtrA
MMINNVVSLINAIIDWFYPPFKKIMPVQTFRYAACGGGNTLLDIGLFAFWHDYIFEGEIVHTPLLTLKPYIAAFILAFVVTFPIGFFLSRYVVFDASGTRKREQLPKYLLVVGGAILLNYFFFNVFVGAFGMNAIVAKVFITVIVVLFSYYSQKHFTFK